MEVLTGGFLVADIIAADLPKIADQGELIFAPRGIQLSIGGHPANVSIDLRQLGLPAGQVGLVGAIGNDTFGQFIERTLKDHQILTHLQEVEGVGTTKNMIIVVKDQDRRFHLELGASWHLDPGIVKAFLKKTRPDIFYVATGIVGKLDDDLVNVVRTAKEMGSVTFVDIVRPFGKAWDFVIPSFEFTDIFHCNDFEATEITRRKQLLEALSFIIDAGVKTVFVTTGQRGAAAMTSAGDYIEQSALKVEAVDPTGAGDAFCAGVIFELISRRSIKNLEKALSVSELTRLLLYGQATGAACVTGIGTTTNVTKETVQKLLDEQGSQVLEGTKAQKLR